MFIFILNLLPISPSSNDQNLNKSITFSCMFSLLSSVPTEPKPDLSKGCEVTHGVFAVWYSHSKEL